LDIVTTLTAYPLHKERPMKTKMLMLLSLLAVIAMCYAPDVDAQVVYTSQMGYGQQYQSGAGAYRTYQRTGPLGVTVYRSRGSYVANGGGSAGYSGAYGTYGNGGSTGYSGAYSAYGNGGSNGYSAMNYSSQPVYVRAAPPAYSQPSYYAGYGGSYSGGYGGGYTGSFGGPPQYVGGVCINCF
jgi:hypothetical protein